MLPSQGSRRPDRPVIEQTARMLDQRWWFDNLSTQRAESYLSELDLVAGENVDPVRGRRLRSDASRYARTALTSLSTPERCRSQSLRHHVQGERWPGIGNRVHPSAQHDRLSATGSLRLEYRTSSTVIVDLPQRIASAETLIQTSPGPQPGFFFCGRPRFSASLPRAVKRAPARARGTFHRCEMFLFRRHGAEHEQYHLHHWTYCCRRGGSRFFRCSIIIAAINDHSCESKHLLRIAC